ncbi:SirB2 family protein [Acinetobacter sp. MD2(2019)]|uniref:SirB2 family protein n=1 Tax=Acinetobacter sp. MD2(2019) TaxID=2605273 RepID=UPI002D1F7C8D|nr:SirB2 family protein [Acinetobacter sp. MD2(2019)]MEB3754610.1 SirB2 family protein [Acinetobacter sp. MD2(2019)]
MDVLLALKIAHGCAIFFLFISFIGQSLFLMKAEPQDICNWPYRRIFILIQHGSFALILLTGLTLLYLKHFQVQSWFYAKMILFVVIVSSVIKAFKPSSGTEILWVQRRGGMVLAWIAFFAILYLVKIKPALF